MFKIKVWSSPIGRLFALFQKPHHGAVVLTSWPHSGASATFLNSKDKCPTDALGWRGGGGGKRAWSWQSHYICFCCYAPVIWNPHTPPPPTTPPSMSRAFTFYASERKWRPVPRRKIEWWTPPFPYAPHTWWSLVKKTCTLYPSVTRDDGNRWK